MQAEGAPTDQGQAQGRALRARIAARAADVRESYGLTTWWATRGSVRRGPARALGVQLPWQHERMEGLARGAQVSLGALQIAEATERVSGSGFSEAPRIEARLEIPPEIEPLLILRESLPDAGGFPSVELTCAHWSGCLAGVNSEGLGAICLIDRDIGRVSVRFLAQELLFRSRDLDAGIEHLRRRGAYLGASGLLLVADPNGARGLHFDTGRLEVIAAPGMARLAAEPTVHVDTQARVLRWSGNQARAPEAPAGDIEQ